MGTPETNHDWRLTPKEQLFKPPKREDGVEHPASVIISDAIMRLIAEGHDVREERGIMFREILAESVISHEPNPLAGYADLMQALYADYAYYDASEHLEGFSEGMIYGMTSLAETIVRLLSERSESFLPASALFHPDVLLASMKDHTMDVDKLVVTLGIPRNAVIVAIVNLEAERLIVTTVVGQRRLYFPSLMGAEYASRIWQMAMGALETAEGDISDSTDRMMELADFTDRDAVRRAVSVVTKAGESFSEGSASVG